LPDDIVKARYPIRPRTDQQIPRAERRAPIFDRKACKRDSSGHCKQWLPRLECPDASVITVINGFHDGKRYQGLSIKCRRLEKGV